MGRDIPETKRRVSILLPIRREGDTLLIYLQKRAADAERIPNYFGFWGGGADGDETPEQALVREVREELGLEIDLKQVSLFNRYEFLGSLKDVFLFEPTAGWEESIVIGEGEFGKWFPTKEALKRTDIIFEDKVVINDLERRLLKKPIV